VEDITEENRLRHSSAIRRHKKKDGTIIMMDIIAHDVLYENNPARLVLANDVTEKLQVEAELANQQALQQKLITETSIQVQEREREEIGKELHDNISQILATAKLYLQHAMKKDDLHSELLEKSQEYITLAIEESRKLSHTLIAPSLGEITLIDAIRDLIGDIHFTTSLRLELNTGNFNEEGINKNIKLMFYRVVQEQINNIMKHSGAQHATIELRATAEYLLLTIRDDGIGFDTQKTPGGIGLRNISNRARFYDGSIRIISAPGKGCTLEVIIPVKNAG
jgi:two-component system sensor histidine kinase UhpB